MDSAMSPYHPGTLLRNWGDGTGFRIGDALTGVVAFGATGSGKTSGPARHIALSFLAAGMGGVVLCSKKEERALWEELARLAGRSDDLIIFSAGGPWSFNFLDWEATRSGEGGGLTMNIVALLDEIASTLGGGAGSAEGGGDNKFFEDALHHMNANLVDLPTFAGIPITLPLLRSIVVSAPQTLKDVSDPAWRKNSVCAAILDEADTRTRDAGDDVRADFEETRNYWLQEFPALSDKTRGIIVLSFSMLVRPLITRPLLQLFGQPTTNITPEACFDGKIVIVDVPVQEYRLAGKLANLAWKYCFQVAVMRRTPPRDGSYLRPVFLWADEAQNFVSRFDAEYQAVARSAGGCTVYLTQNRESFRRVLGNDDAVDSLLGNLQAKFFCQNGSTGTNGWASSLMGERWTEIIAKSGGASGIGLGNTDGRVSANSGFSIIHQKRNYVEAVQFATLRRGGESNDFLVDCFVYNGGELYPSRETKEDVPYKFLTFNQKG
jgi:hypothetical protein